MIFAFFLEQNPGLVNREGMCLLTMSVSVSETSYLSSLGETITFQKTELSDLETFYTQSASLWRAF